MLSTLSATLQLIYAFLSDVFLGTSGSFLALVSKHNRTMNSNTARLSERYTCHFEDLSFQERLPWEHMIGRFNLLTFFGIIRSPINDPIGNLTVCT